MKMIWQVLLFFLLAVLVVCLLLKKLPQVKQKGSTPRIEEKQHVTEEVKSAYKGILSICIPDSPALEEVYEYIDTKLEDKESYGPAIFSPIEALSDFLDKKDLLVFAWLDWKSELEEFEYVTQQVLQKNFNLTIELPDPGNYESEFFGEVLDEVVSDYRKVLLEIGLEITFLDVNGDAYLYLIHPLKDTEQLLKYAEEVGFGTY